MNNRICKKCLLRDMNEADIYKSVKNHIERIEPELRTSDEIYEMRLTICSSCDYLLNGMCRKCGCYVEFRAAVAKNICPSVPKLW